ncbi:hypothetical protein JMG10_36645 [Nostoc ellipsosporum NOK]|nr:hypothetical protein [Nostoc ellipsosporum NOK]
MNKSFVTKFILPSLAGSVFGFSTLISIIGPGFAAQSTVITSPNGHAISNVVLYLQDASGNITKVKIDNFSDAPQETLNYDPTAFLQNYSGYNLVAYTVKAGDNKSKMGPGEGELVLVSDVPPKTLPTGKADYTYEYTQVSSISSVPSVPEESAGESVNSGVTDGSTNSTTPVNNDTTETTKVPEPTTSNTETAKVSEPTTPNVKSGDSTKPVSVPEPTTITALALFGLGSLFTKKKLTSSSKADL